MLGVGKKVKLIEEKLETLKMLASGLDDIDALIELIEESGDSSLENELEESVHSLEKKIDKAKVETLLSGKYDSFDAIITLHAGAGGTEAQDWTDMLYRMYQMYCEKTGFKLKVLDVLDGDEAGLKSITFEVAGEYAYGYLKCEIGRASCRERV